METESKLMACKGTEKKSRADLALIPTPDATSSHQPIAHARLIEALVEALSFRHINVVADEYAVSTDGMKLFGVLELDYEFTGCRFAIGIRNANDKSLRLAMTVGYQVLVCSNLAFMGDFTPVLAKHSKRFDLLDSLSIGLDRMQRQFKPLQATVSRWKEVELSNTQAKEVVYDAVIEKLIPAKLLGDVHHHYFEPEYDEFKDRTLWSLSNSFTSAYKLLPPMQQFQRTAKLNPFLNRYSPPF
jgi:hypothetical protein